MSKKPLKLGFKNLSHAEKMAAKKAHREQLAGMAYSDPRTRHRIESMVNAMLSMNRKNGVGRPQPFKQFLVSREPV